MGVGRIVATVITGAIAIVMFFITYRQHKEKGYIFTNAWMELHNGRLVSIWEVSE